MSCINCKRDLNADAKHFNKKFDDPLLLRLFLFIIIVIISPALIILGLIMFFNYYFVTGELSLIFKQKQKMDLNVDELELYQENLINENDEHNTDTN